MITDCGNQIDSIKFHVYIYDKKGTALIQVASREGSLPKKLCRPETVPIDEIVPTMDKIVKAVRDYETFRQSQKGKLPFEFFCLDCNTAIRREHLEFKHRSGTFVATCPRCGNLALERGK